MTDQDILLDVTQRRLERRQRVRSHLTGTAAAVLMIAAAVAALVLTNVGFHDVLHDAMTMPVGVYVGDLFIGMSLEHFVNDLLMALFFLTVGCELKYEMTVGALARPKDAVLPIVAALGGVCGPAAVFLAITAAGGGAQQGWAIPTATDIAFALAVMSLFGDRIPIAAKVFFSTLAIADDLVAIVVIALFYTTQIDVAWLVLSLAAVAALVVLNRLQVYKLTPYVLVGAFLWLCFYQAGIHATLAGVVLAFALPAKSNVQLESFSRWIGERGADFRGRYDDTMSVLGQHEATEVARQIEEVSHRVTPPLQRVEHGISLVVNFVVLPVFAFANAQVFVAGADLAQVVTSPVTLGVFFGLLCGKPVGIMLTTFVMVRFLGFSLPKGAAWGHIAGIAMLAGIGFTMSILVAGLAYADEALVTDAKVGILAGTFAAACIGLVYLGVYIKLCARRDVRAGGTKAEG